MTSTGDNGRLCNQIIRNLAVSFIAERYDLSVNYFNKDLIAKLGIDLFSGSNVYDRIQRIHNYNYFSIYNNGSLTYNLEPNIDYFQTKGIILMIYNHLHNDVNKTKIIEKNPFKHRYNANNDAVVHIRLTDVAKFNPGIEYYKHALRKITFDNLYIASDDINHNTVQSLIEIYPDAKIIEDDEVGTIQMASTCKHVILSHGTFSAMIGYLAFFSDIYYPSFGNLFKWCGDLFSIKNWVEYDITQLTDSA
jgi:hypothetical protein